VGGDYTGWVAAWAVYSIGAAVTAPTLWVTAAARAFERDRSFAMTVVLCGVGLASTFGPALSRFLIDSSDWREAFRWLALIWGGGCLALCLLWFRSKPIATPAARGAAAAATGPVAARTLIASAAVVQLTAAVFLVMTVLAGLMVSLSPLLVDGGMPQSTAAKVAGALGLGVITGKLGSGRIFEKLRVPVLAGMVMAALALACVVLGLTGLPTALVALGCFALGMSSGGLMAISACLPARLFDQREFGVVYGWLIGVMGAASIAGPLCASLVHDWLGSYRLVLWSGIAVAALGAILLSSASRSSMQVVPSDG
jgi:predicted MFS family arabinose efflux permease